MNRGKESNEIILLPKSGALTLVQKDIQLVPGGKYRIGAEIMTKNLTAPRSGVILYNWAWAVERGTVKFPENTEGWQKIEAVVTLPRSRYKLYSFAVYTVGNEKGEIRVRNPFLIPIDENSATAVVPALEISRLNRLIPVDPLLTEINADFAMVTFLYDTQRLPQQESAYEGVVRTRMEGENFFSDELCFAIKDGKIKADLGKLPPGNGNLKIALREKQSKKVIASAQYPIRALTPSCDIRKGKRLNNLVSRLVFEDAEDKEYRFSNPRTGWVFIHLDKSTAETKGYLNDEEIPGIIQRSGEPFETMRYLADGMHKVRFSGTAGGKLTVHSIPEVFTYTYPAPQFNNLKRYYGDFMYRYLFPVINTFNYGYPIAKLPKGAFEDVIGRGKRWFSIAVPLSPWMGKEVYKNEVETPEELGRRLQRYLHGKNCINGLAYDEIEIGGVRDKHTHTQGLWSLLDEEKPVYTWSSGVKFDLSCLNADYLSACFNNGGGQGKFLFECYARTQPTEVKAQEYLEDYLNESMRLAKKMFPRSAEHSAIINGMYTKIGVYCTDCYPEVDVKRFWDLYLHRLACDRDFEGLYGIGPYALGNCDEENLRWFCRLIRHYALEGNTEMLSDRYGYRYIPGHLQNGDFTQKLEHWVIQNAGDNTIRHETVGSYGTGIQKRQEPSTGNHVCVFKRDNKTPNKLFQIMKGFVPGKFYALRYAVADLAEVKAKKGTSSILELNATLEGAKIVTDSMPVAKYDFKREVGKYINRHTIVFQAKKQEIKLTFSDWKNDSESGAPVGQELMLNFIQVKPYYNDEH